MTLDLPWLLAIGAAVVAALVALAIVLVRRRRSALAAAGAPGGRGGGPGAGIWLTIAGVAVLAVAVAGPSATVPVPRVAGTVILAVDVSNSMAATDVAPSRLEAAKQAAAAFIQAQPDSVDIGIIAFQDGALTTVAPTPDHEAALAAVNRLTPSGGTSLGEAIVAALSAVTGEHVTIGSDGALPDLGYWPSATVVLLSDGENRGEPAELEAAATAAENAGVHVDTVGVGTAAGATVEVDGVLAHTALDEDVLRAIAGTTGGAYHPASEAAELDDVADSIQLRLDLHPQPLPLAGPIAALAILLLLLGGILTLARTGRLV